MENATQESEKDNASKFSFKGTKEGLLIIFPDDDDSTNNWNDLIQQLGNTLDGAKKFWIGASTSVDLGAHKLDETQIKRLYEMLNKRYHLNLEAIYSSNHETRDFAQKSSLKVGDSHPNSFRYSLSSSSEHNEKGESPASATSGNNTNALYLKQTLRSGQSARFDGNIIIYGDTNPGSEIVASGDIIVIGSLRGIAHAGAKGNEEAQIIATNLRPTQLRIASYIGRPPDGQKPIADYPEYAWISNEEIHIGPLRNKK